MSRRRRANALRRRFAHGWRKRARNALRNSLARSGRIPKHLLASYGHAHGAGLRAALLEARGDGATHVSRWEDNLHIVYREGNGGKYEEAGVMFRDGHWTRTSWGKAAFGGWLPTTATPIGDAIRRAA